MSSPLGLWLRPGLIGLHVFAVAAVVFCVLMGLWQAGVYDSRQGDERAGKADGPGVALEAVWGPDEPFQGRLINRPVTVTGRFAPATEQVWVRGKEQDGRTGVWLVAPFIVAGEDSALLVDSAILVLRGWAPSVTSLPDVPSDPVLIDAVLQPGESGSAPFDASDRSIGSLRIPALTNELPYDLYSGFAISTSSAVSGGLDLATPPEPGVSWTTGLRNLAYALQWWVFGAFAVFMWWRMSTESVAAAKAKVA